MDRLACINLPGLALQVALRRFPAGLASPLVLVREDRPTSPIVALNRAAREQGLRPGLRYSEALSIVSDLQAVLVSASELAEAREEILGVLAGFSPVVEACPFDEGSFWVGASGLTGLYGTEAQWGAALRAQLAGRRYRCVVVVGLTRGGTYVLARTRRRSTVVQSAEAEQRALDAAPLGVFPVSARHRRLLGRLGLTTLGAVLQHPTEELSRRFGAELIRDLRALQTLSALPLQGTAPAVAQVSRQRLEAAVSDRARLAALLVPPLLEGLSVLGRRGKLLAELRVVLVLESGALVTEVLRPAEPTVQNKTLVRLLALRLERCALPEAVVEWRLALSEVPLPPGSGDLFAPEVQRDLRRGSEALALVRARWGNAVVVRAVLADSHVPERSFRWEPLESLTAPRPSPSPRASAPETELAAVRRIRVPGAEVSGNPSGQRLGRSCRLKVSGPQGVDKEYWFLRNARREVAWVSWDRLNGQPRWEGMVD